jgi:hypothetical protein
MSRFRRQLAAASAVALLLSVVALAADDLGSAHHPYPLGAMAAVPQSGGWRVRIDDVTPDAAALVAAVPTNAPPKPGYRFVLLNLTTRFSGSGTSSIFQRLAFYVRSSRGRTYDFALTRDSCGLVPSALDDLRRFRSGAIVHGALCISVRKRDVRGLLFVAEPSTVTPHQTQVFFMTH